MALTSDYDTNVYSHKDMATQDETTNDQNVVTEVRQEKELPQSASLSSRLRMIKTISMFLIYMGLVWTLIKAHNLKYQPMDESDAKTGRFSPALCNCI